MSLEVLHADIVDVEVVASGDSPDAIENVFRVQSAGDGVHDHVSVRKNFVDRTGYGFHHLLGTLEGDVAGHTDGEIGTITVAGTAAAYAVHFQHAIHAGNRGDNFITYSGGSGIEQRVDGL